MKQYVFDSYALLTLLEDEPGADLVARLLQAPDTEIFISTINLGEIYYIILKRNGAGAAEKVLENIMLEDSITVKESPWPMVKAAAELKAKGGISYADAFVIALSRKLQAPLVTGDPEIIKMSKALNMELIVL